MLNLVVVDAAGRRSVSVPSGPGEYRGHPVRVRYTATGYDGTLARRLWDISERATGVSFP